MKSICQECQKKFVSVEFMNRHADEAHPDWRTPKSRGWRTPWGFIDFAQPVTYEHACQAMRDAMPELEVMKAGRNKP